MAANYAFLFQSKYILGATVEITLNGHSAPAQDVENLELNTVTRNGCFLRPNLEIESYKCLRLEGGASLCAGHKESSSSIREKIYYLHKIRSILDLITKLVIRH